MPGANRWKAAYALVILCVLAIVGSYYDQRTGLTVLLSLPANSHDWELPAVRATDHAHNEEDVGYDGQFYAQMAVDPLLRDPDIDRALDNPGYRAHRVLLSWIAWAITPGAGAAARLEAFAWINIVAWLMMAWLLTRWLPPTDARMFVLWAGVLVGHGWVMSIRHSLTDGPSVLLMAIAIALVERRRSWWSALVIGISGLARETNIAAGVVLLREIRADLRSVLGVGARLILCILPLALWLDYLRSIYGQHVFAGGGHISVPLVGLLWKLRMTIDLVAGSALTGPAVITAATVLALFGQLAALVWCTREWVRHRTLSLDWLLIAWVFAGLALTAHRVIWDGTPGAFTRVLLPLSVGVNVLLGGSRTAPWWLIVLANLSIVSLAVL
ncbi:MAG: hypothetical protein AB7L71_13175 [Vicinamibacterales bacterium]